MFQTFRKSGREPDALPASTDAWEAKRIHGEETDRLCHLLQLDKTLAQEEEERAPNEELVNGIMRSLEEEIGAACFTSDIFSNSADNSASFDISSGQEGETVASDAGVDLSYLEASDAELSIPLSPALDLNDEVWLSCKETSEGLLENPDLKSLSEIWHFEDDIENYQKIAFSEDDCEAKKLQDYMKRDFLSQEMFVDGEFSAAWHFKTAGCL